MFWTLWLAHLTADYPLQTDRMVLAKKHWPGLIVHVSIHWVVMMLFFLPVIGVMWPFIILVALIHFCIDAFKNFLGIKRPQWVIGSYVLDQTLHMISLILVMTGVAKAAEVPVWPVGSPWVIYIIGLLLATYVWFVSERILVYRSDNWQMSVTSAMWPRMGARFLLFVLMAAPLSISWLLTVFAVVVVAFLYRRHNYPRSWLLLDTVVALVSALIVRGILLFW